MFLRWESAKRAALFEKFVAEMELGDNLIGLVDDVEAIAETRYEAEVSKECRFGAYFKELISRMG